MWHDEHNGEENALVVHRRLEGWRIRDMGTTLRTNEWAVDRGSGESLGMQIVMENFPNCWVPGPQARMSVWLLSEDLNDTFGHRSRAM
jgi:hypothetical protein